MRPEEPTTIGLSESAHEKLKSMRDDGHFAELLDGYRLAVGLALAQGIEPPEVQKRTTVFNVHTFDPDQSIKISIEVLLGNKLQDVPIYRIAERLADWGVRELTSQAETGSIDVIKILDQADAQNESDG